MNVIFDTNAYRGFCAKYIVGKSQDEIQQALHKLRDCERKKNITSHLNLFVLAELLKHLADENDPAYMRCLQAVQVTFWHTEDKRTINFIPPPEFEICSQLFEKLPNNFDVFLKKLGALYFQTIENSNTQNLLYLKPAYAEISQWIEDYKQSFIESYSHYLSDEDPSNANNWRVYSSDKNKRRTFLAHVKKDQRRLELAIGLILFIIKHLDFPLNISKDELVEKANLIKNNRKIGFELMLRILNLFATGGGYNLSTGNRPNDVIDFLFALSLDTSKSRILVSEDKDLHNVAKQVNATQHVMKLETYLKVVGFIS